MVVISGTRGPSSTHITLDASAGLTKYDESFADITTLQPVDKYSLGWHRGRLTPAELARIEEQLRIYLGL